MDLSQLSIIQWNLTKAKEGIEALRKEEVPGSGNDKYLSDAHLYLTSVMNILAHVHAMN
jgi:hypothetical protein